MAKNDEIAHLEVLRLDTRDEIKRRIEQRDKYSIQLTISLGAIFAFSLSNDGFSKAMLAAPIVSIYFTVLILYSYRIHKILSKYMREVIEVKSSKLIGTDVNIEWEHFYIKNSVPGIRKVFFIGSMWVVLVSSLLYLLVTQYADKDFLVILLFASIILIFSAIQITLYFKEG